MFLHLNTAGLMRQRRNYKRKTRIPQEDRGQKTAGDGALTSELAGKMGWFMFQVVLFRAPCPSEEELDSAGFTIQGFLEIGFWKEGRQM